MLTRLFVRSSRCSSIRTRRVARRFGVRRCVCRREMSTGSQARIAVAQSVRQTPKRSMTSTRAHIHSNTPADEQLDAFVPPELPHGASETNQRGRVVVAKERVQELAEQGAGTVLRISSSEFGLVMRTSHIPLGDTIAIAVSGGVDSMALMYLVLEWQMNRIQGARRTGTQPPYGSVVVLTVDHKLRPESTSEAHLVKQWVEKYGVAHEILTVEWPGGVAPRANKVQAEARAARHRLLASFCASHRIPWLFMGHHEGDAIETLFFRMFRGSGLEGLHNMRLKQAYAMSGHPVSIVRPFLGFRKARLEGTCLYAGQDWVEDPSNSDRAFARSRVRDGLRGVVSSSRQARDLLSLFLQHVKDASTQVQMYVAARTRTMCVFVKPLGHAVVSAQRLFAEDLQVQCAIISRIMTYISPGSVGVRERAVLNVLKSVEICERDTTNALGNVLVHTKVDHNGSPSSLLLLRGGDRASSTIQLTTRSTDLRKHGRLLWDHLFRVSLSRPLLTPVGGVQPFPEDPGALDELAEVLGDHTPTLTTAQKPVVVKSKAHFIRALTLQDKAAVKFQSTMWQQKYGQTGIEATQELQKDIRALPSFIWESQLPVVVERVAGFERLLFIPHLPLLRLSEPSHSVTCDVRMNYTGPF